MNMNEKSDSVIKTASSMIFQYLGVCSSLPTAAIVSVEAVAVAALETSAATVHP
jgi:hypothetical protein